MYDFHCCHVVIGGRFSLLSCCHCPFSLLSMKMVDDFHCCHVVIGGLFYCCHVVIGGLFLLLSCCNWWTIFIVVML